MGSASPFKAVVSMMLGFAFAAVGMDGVSGNVRLTFGFTELISGISFLVAVIGLFGLGELLHDHGGRPALRGHPRPHQHPRRLPRDLHAAQALGDALAQRTGRLLDGDHAGRADRGLVHELWPGQTLFAQSRKDGFGKGEPAGVVAPETADHAAGTCAILPMLALGVPGSATAAVMMGGLMIWGLTPGPMLFIERPDFVWSLIASMYLGNVMAVVLVLATVPFFAAILRIPFSIIGPMIVVVCFIGAYTIAGSTLDLWLALAFRHPRLRLQEARLPDRADGPGHGARRQGRRRFPPVDDFLQGLARHLLDQLDAGRLDHDDRHAALVLAADRQAHRQAARGDLKLKTMAASERIGFVGAGLMGRGMAGNLLKAGYPLRLFIHRQREGLAALFALGAAETDDLREIARESDVIIICVDKAETVRSVVAGLLPELRSDHLLIDATTSDPAVTREIADELRRHGVSYADAPVTGGPLQAEAGVLGSLVGCDAATFARVHTVVAHYSKAVQRIGEVGSGHFAKLLNNFVTHGTVTLLAEAYGRARENGVDWQALYAVMEAGAARSGTLEKMVKPALSGDFDGSRFFIRNAQKDVAYFCRIAEGSERGPSELGETIRSVFDRAVAADLGERYVSALLDPDIHLPQK